ncbi:hypothetical protein J7K27_08025 [Candidatus Bathyarchaeota archaeon]|nr:hypothetical protein [Candidatus Bathyarchaeota archaeon]
MSIFQGKEKRYKITFRISKLVKERLEMVAELFNMRPSQYVKALLYKDLGLFQEPIDRRRRSWRRKNRDL